ncbi:hypothetical protein B0H10DRAFT_2217314 [Mycena sp. CBHHK59/15]|nr:hypothetical protein B0H10DRAFT_2217314 [Mycena sp. CBHHK59/15]
MGELVATPSDSTSLLDAHREWLSKRIHVLTTLLIRRSGMDPITSVVEPKNPALNLFRNDPQGVRVVAASGVVLKQGVHATIAVTRNPWGKSSSDSSELLTVVSLDEGGGSEHLRTLAVQLAHFCLSSGGRNEEDDQDLLNPNKGETPAFHVLRYLLSVCAYTSASSQLVKNAVFRKGLGIQVNVVTFPVPDNHLDEAIYEEIVTEMAARTETSCDTVRSLFKFPRSGVAGTLHAEAGMMGLACDSSALVDEQHRVLFPSFPAQLPIGVGKKCCWCCWMLGEFLKNDRGREFILPGTHGIIFPWIPPKHGIPVDVLDRLEKLLVLKLEEAITTHTVSSSSRQSSPSSTFDDADFEYDSEERSIYLKAKQKSD